MRGVKEGDSGGTEGDLRAILRHSQGGEQAETPASARLVSWGRGDNNLAAAAAGDMTCDVSHVESGVSLSVLTGK